MPKIDPLHKLSGQPWAVTKKVLDALVHDIQHRGAAPEASAAAVDAGGESPMARILASARDRRPRADVRDGVAVIRVRGALIKEADYWSWYFNESSYEGIRADIQAALDDASARAIVLDVDSPGGTVDGALELADFVHAAGAKKPIYAFANGQMTSAALKFASQAKEISAVRTAEVGSIGVRMVHIDFSGMDERLGIKITHLTAGKYKALGNDSEPLSEEAREYFQGILDRYYTIFVDTVARGRDMTAEQVLAMADGRIYVAEEAVEIGMIDRLDTDLSAFIDHIRKQEEIIMDLAQLKQDYPDLYAAARAEGEQAAKAEATAGTEAAVTTERTRCAGIVAAVLGEEIGAKVAAVIESGATVDQAVALAGALGGKAAAGDEASRQAILEGIAASHHKGVEPEQGKADPKSPAAIAKKMAELANQAY
jgi:signal peptide peptidase SppA